MAGNRVGTKILSGSGEVAAAGANVRVYSITALSGGTAGASTFKTGGSSGTTLLSLTCGTVSASNHFMFPQGMLFAGGCYWTKDANTSSIVVTYETEI